MLRNYEQLSALHIWLSKRVARGLRIPETLDETTELVRQDPTGFPAKKFRCILVPCRVLLLGLFYLCV